MALLASLYLLREVEASTATLSAWTLGHDELELIWNLPGSKSDRMELGVKRAWPCVCGLAALFCPYHLAITHVAWLQTLPSNDGGSAPIFPTISGGHPSKASVAKSFEALGGLMGQPLKDSSGLRLFGGHTHRVTGPQLLAVLGVEVNKTRILARHTGDTILRYVQDAPLKSLRLDLGLPPSIGRSTTSFGFNGCLGTSAATRDRLLKLEAAFERLQAEVSAQALDVVSMATGLARTDDRVSIQNMDAAAIHMAKTNDTGHI